MYTGYYPRSRCCCDCPPPPPKPVSERLEDAKRTKRQAIAAKQAELERLRIELAALEAI